MASGIYTQFKQKLMQKAYNLHTGGDVLKIALYSNGHTFNAADTTYTTTHELATAGNYTRGGKILAGQSVTISGTAGKWDANDVVWIGGSFTTYHCVIYNATVSNDLICSIDFGGAQTVTGGTFTIQWNSSGIITIDS